MKKYHLPLLCGLATLLSLALLPLGNKAVSEVKASESMSLEASGDAFKLLNKQYSADESFVYTGDLHFNNDTGVAGGLAFGAQENDHYYVINMDRENHIKLMYFASNGGGGYNVDVLRECDFIGNDKMTDQERNMVNPRIRTIENVNLKVILTREDTHAYAEFYVEGIKRFGVDTVIDLNDMGKPYTYQGGYIGMNCFNANVTLENIEYGQSDYSYFSEPYRNQYHLQPFAKWTNDPNALVYYNGWYHVFYQTNPFGLLWGDMYWGHARSRDLIHFEFLPICLFPERAGMGFGPGDAFMWSGCAIAYTAGMSHEVDMLNWFPNSGGSGLFAIFTRDGGLQDQIIMTSEDEGLTWTKRQRIPQDVKTGYTNKIDWRDPKVFTLLDDGMGGTRVWGMTLSSYNLNKGWILYSYDLLDWNVCYQFPLPTPECIGVGYLKDEDNNTHAYLTNKSRTYILGTLEFNESTRQAKFIDEDGVDISTYDVHSIPLKSLDFGPDSYASQSFYINDPSSDYNGKDIVLNWFSGDLNASFCTGPGEYAGLRGRWNGGFTVPVEYGLKTVNGELLLSQKPITVNNAHLDKTSIVNVSNEDINSDSENLLKGVHTHIFELEASIDVNDNSPITFRVDVGDDEYMQFGWNETDGYYVDRTYLDDKGINTNIDWHTKYASHVLGNSNTKTFYVLSDNGGLEVFCENYAVSFYFVTTASIYSTGALLKADSAHINTLKLNEVKSIYRDNAVPGEGTLYVSSSDIALDNKFATSKYVTAWYSGNDNLTWTTIDNDEVVTMVSSNQGAEFTALKEGTAQFKVAAGNQEQIINITVYNSAFTSDLSFDKDDIVSGQWLMGEDSITGEKTSGNGFLLAKESGSDFTFTTKFDIVEGQAASVIFRASSDMSTFIAANYDANEKVAKLWTKKHGEIARSGTIDIDKHDVTLSIKASDNIIQVNVNGVDAITHMIGDDEPLTGRFGLNVFSGKAEFKKLSILKEEYSYTSGDLVVPLSVDQFIIAIYNVTLGNIHLEQGFYYQDNGNLYIRRSYFELLPSNGTYRFTVKGSAYSFNLKVEVNMTSSFEVDDLNVESGTSVNVYVGNHAITSVSINGKVIDASKYYVQDYTLHIDESCFKEGDNEVVLNNDVTFNVNMTKISNKSIGGNGGGMNSTLILIIVIAAGASVLLIAGTLTIIFVIRAKKKKAVK